VPATFHSPLPPVADAEVLLVADQIADLGGNERAFAALLDLLPGATALSAGFAGTNMPRGHRPDWHRRVRLVGMGGRRRAFLLPWYARRMRAADPGRPQLVVVVAHGGWGSAVRAPGARHVCYSAGLPPNLYGQTEDFLSEYPRPLRPALRRAVPRLRVQYRGLIQRAGRLVVNSRYSAAMVERELGRSADVVYPPVRTRFFTPPARGPDRVQFVLVARLVRQKRVDVAVEAFRALPWRLVVVGDGPEGGPLRRSAPPNVEFAGPLEDRRLRELYRSSSGFVCTSLESFGIAVCEALSSGVPVIALRAGGPTETVRDGKTGLLLERMEPRALAEAVHALAARALDPALCRASVERFSEERFKREMAEILREELIRARHDSDLAGASVGDGGGGPAVSETPRYGRASTDRAAGRRTARGGRRRP
jgi:glycosyltransferase involved in cell wall biosynthesis